jgi:hypothetical protein
MKRVMTCLDELSLQCLGLAGSTALMVLFLCEGPLVKSLPLLRPPILVIPSRPMSPTRSLKLCFFDLALLLVDSAREEALAPFRMLVLCGRFFVCFCFVWAGSHPLPR